MNKDTVVASVIGFGLGLVAAIALWVVPRVFPKTSPSPQPQLVAQQEVESAQDESSADLLTVTSPVDGDINSVGSVNLIGVAPGASLVAITTSERNLIASVEEGGNFTASLDLTQGANHIIVTSYKDKQESVKKLYVFYYPEDI